MKNFVPRTDLALEIAESMENGISGVEIIQEECDLEQTTVSWVKISDNNAAEKMCKPIGNYITIESPYLKVNDPDAHKELIALLSKYLGKLHNLDNNALVLVVGLGNWRVTPDSLGPKVVSKILVTRHIRENLPEEIDDCVRGVAAISPGVMGITGIETVEIIKGIAEKIKPDLIIAVDALAARRAGRINSTIQMSDTGVSPGAGVGNKRGSINRETMGVPVIAIGVPTVVDAATLVNDTLDFLLEDMINSSQKGKELYKMLWDMQQEDKYKLICHILDPYNENLFVTPKEVDAVVDSLANIVANAVNIAVHPGVNQEDINKFTY